MSRIKLDMRDIQARLLQLLKSFMAECVVSHATGDDGTVAKQRSHVSEICRGTAKLTSRRQDVPEQLA